jgi:hypothetical protein
VAALFVLSAAGFSSGGGTATLHGLSPTTICVAGPDLGHLPSQRFVELWPATPPVAVVSFTGQPSDGTPPDGTPQDAVVVLSSPILTGAVLTYQVEVVEGALPAESGPCTLFIDATDHPAISLAVRAVRAPGPGAPPPAAS